MSARRNHGKRGVTLIELIVVVGIIGIILSMGALFWRQSRLMYALQATANQIKSAASEARATALEQNRETVLRVDAEEHTVELIEPFVTAGWEFDRTDREDRAIVGSRGEQLRVRPSGTQDIEAVRGRYGQGIQLAGSAHLEGDPMSYQSPLQGLDISMEFSSPDPEAEQLLVHHGEQFRMGMTEQGHLAARVGPMTVISENPLAADTWYSARMRYMKNQLHLFINDERVAQTAENNENTFQFQRTDEPLIVGGQVAPGTIIERLYIASLIPEILHEIPQQISVVETVETIFFPDGTARATGPVLLHDPGGSRGRRVSILPSGFVEQEEWTPDEDPGQPQNEQQDSQNNANPEQTSP